MNIVSKLDFLEKNPRIATLSIFVFVFLLFIDFYISSITDVLNNFIKTTSGIALFLSLTILSMVASYFVINHILVILEKQRSIFPQYKRTFGLIQIFLYSLSVFLIVNIIVEHKFYSLNLGLIMLVSYGSSVVMSLFASLKLFSWFRDNKNRFSFLFGLSIFFIAINNLVSIILFALLLSEKPLEIDFLTPVIFNFECNEDTFYCLFKENIINIQSYTMMIYFAFFWISNYSLLHHHIKRIGRIRFFTLITLPIVLFFFVFIYHYDELYSLNENLQFDESVIFAFQIFLVILFITLCGILYGIGFRSVANLLKMSSHIEKYLKMASYGIILFFITANATIAGASMPPFGMPSIIFLPFALILFYVGIYHSIIAISNDISIRKYIKKSTYNELKIMGNLAESQMIDNMKEKVLGMTKKYSEEIHQKSNSETMETEEDLKNYLNDAINIFKKNSKGS